MIPGGGRRRLSLLHLVGSAVDAFSADISTLYARGCLEALASDERYDHHVAYVSPGGSWRFPADLSSGALACSAVMSLADALAYIKVLGIDVVVPQMFCLPGMTAYRGLFDVLGIPYLGNAPHVMANAADKSRARALVAGYGVAVPAGELVHGGHRPTLTLPVVVKPVDADNSMGVSLVSDWGLFDVAVHAALAHGTAALVESYVPLGREVRCGIVVRDGELVCLPLEEYAVDGAKPIRGRDDKLRRNVAGELELVAKDPSRAWIVPEDDPVTTAVWDAARRCHLALGCRHYSLFDFRIDPDGTPWFLEAGPYCSFAPASVIATMAAARGIHVTDLFAIVLGEVAPEPLPCLTFTR
jgi:D-alanine-D-alanine ligase